MRRCKGENAMIKLTAYEEEHKGKSVCFTGHRPQSLGKVKLDDLRLELSLLIQDAIEDGYDTFYCGMAMGTDIIAGELTAELREHYPWIRLYAVVPFVQQTQSWPGEWVTRDRHLMQRADETVILYPGYCKGGFLERDRYMVDRSGLLIGVYNDSPRGGTAYTVRYARKKGLEVKLLRPEEYKE